MSARNRILVVEDDASILDLICMNLEAAGYETIAVGDGLEAERLLREKGPDTADGALVDIMLPGKDGFELMEDFKKQGIPVLYLTAKGDVASKVKGLRLGAEDYMVKPFDVLELFVRMEKMLERTGKMKTSLTCGDLVLDLKSHRAFEAGVELELKPMEFDLLAVFLKNRNVLLGRNRLLDMVWGEEFYGETRTVDVHVARLRKKVRACSAIQTIPRRGYRFEDDET